MDCDCCGGNIAQEVTTVSLLVLPLLFLLSVVYWSIRNGISPTPSSSKQTDIILKAVPAELHGSIYDLGSGWGTLAIALAKRFPHCHTTGIENSPIPYAISRMLALFYGLKNLDFLRANFLDLPFEDASLIVCYLYPEGMKKLKSRLEGLRPGTIIISNTFSVPDWKPAETLLAQDVYRSPVYVYVL
jgi:trans-aconitate methyltransferase